MIVLAGLIAAAAIVGLGYATRQERSLPFYGTVLIVIALAYVLFAVMAGASRTIVVESAVAIGFVGIAVAALRLGSVRPAGWLLAGGSLRMASTTSCMGPSCRIRSCPSGGPCFAASLTLHSGGGLVSW